MVEQHRSLNAVNRPYFFAVCSFCANLFLVQTVFSTKSTTFVQNSKLSFGYTHEVHFSVSVLWIDRYRKLVGEIIEPLVRSKMSWSRLRQRRGKISKDFHSGEWASCRRSYLQGRQRSLRRGDNLETVLAHCNTHTDK